MHRPSLNSWQPRLAVILCLLTISLGTASAAAPPATTGPVVAALPAIYDGMPGETVLDNDHVQVRRFVLAPGQGSGRHHPSAAQLQVFVHGGVLRCVADGRETLWRDGRVHWEPPTAPADDGVINVGSDAIVMLWVTLKQAPAPGGTAREPFGGYLSYPNIPGEDLLENDALIVQRFTVYPTQWEGVHAHRPNMLYIHIKGGYWADRTYTKPVHAYPLDPDGEVGWMTPYDLAEGHQSGNVGKEPIDLIWVTLKQ